MIAYLYTLLIHTARLHTLSLLYCKYMDRKLESYKIFPYVAWATIVLFAVFVYTLTLQLDSEVANIAVEIEALADRVDALEEARLKK
jgi:hypothetical protein